MPIMDFNYYLLPTTPYNRVAPKLDNWSLYNDFIFPPVMIAPDNAPSKISADTITADTIAPKSISPPAITPTTITQNTNTPKTITQNTIAPKSIVPKGICKLKENRKSAPELTHKGSSDTSEFKVTRRVSFTDEVGLPLVYIRLVPAKAQSHNSYYSTSESDSDSDNDNDSYYDDCYDPFDEFQTFSLPNFYINSNRTTCSLWSPPRRLIHCFQQPTNDHCAFKHRLSRDCVALENMRIYDDFLKFEATLQVKNLHCQVQAVEMRITTDNWATYRNLKCQRVGPTNGEDSSAPHNEDRYKVEVSVPGRISTVIFALCYRTEHGEYWDNNDCKNYILSRV